MIYFVLRMKTLIFQAFFLPKICDNFFSQYQVSFIFSHTQTGIMKIQIFNKTFYLTQKYLFLSAMLNSYNFDALTKSGQVRAILTETIDSVMNDFQDTFLYGIKLWKLHKSGKAKQTNVYLDNRRQMILWIASQKNAYLIDLFFTRVSYRTIEPEKRGPLDGRIYMFSLKQLQQEVIFVFDNKQERKKYFKMFTLYIDHLRKSNPNYCSYFSNINRIDSRNSIQKGYYTHSQKQVLYISQKIGLSNERENKIALDSCMRVYKISDKNNLSMNCINQYFRIQFCNHSLQPVFQNYSKQKIGNIKSNPGDMMRPIMSTEKFIQFLKEHQKQTPKKIDKILKIYSNANKFQFSFFDFCFYLYNNQYNCIGQLEQNNQNYPLKDYFCYSSHNTYLSGNQLNSRCQVDRYSEDLQNGVKCVEIDIHDGQNKPVVTHAVSGKGLCNKIDFQDVIKAVDITAEKFMSEQGSHYPIILSLQDQTKNPANKQMMLNIMMTHFGSTLFCMNDCLNQFPTLKTLKGKIIVKTSSKQRQMLNFHKMVRHSSSTPLRKLNSSLNFNPNKKNIQIRHLKFQQLKNDLEQQKKQFNQRIGKIQQIFIPMTSMTKITMIFKSESGIAENQSQFACNSIENGNVLKKKKHELIKYTSNSWLRTYPHGLQLASKNYDPTEMFAVGAQIIALNTQTKDDNAWMLYRYFCAGPAVDLKNRGYVLKPEKLRHPQKFLELPKLHTLTIKLIETSGQIVTMRFRGLRQDMQLNIQQGAGKNNFSMTFNYYYSDEGFIIFDIGKQYKECVALRWICQGYRVLEARNKFNYVDSGNRILVHVKLTIGN